MLLVHQGVEQGDGAVENLNAGTGGWGRHDELLWNLFFTL